MKPTPHIDFKVVLGMILLLVIPAALTLRTVIRPGQLVISSPNPSPYGYTWSLLIFILPVAAIAWWFAHHPEYKVERRAFWLTIIAFTAAGTALDVLLGKTFFSFPNSGAVIGIYLPGYDFKHGWGLDIPLEEFLFYFLGSLFMLLVYVWGDLYWVAAYNVDDYDEASKHIDKIVHPHWRSVIWGVVIIIAGVIFKKFWPHPYQTGFPGYFSVLVVGFITPTFVFFNTAKPFVNWRAYSLTLYSLVSVSLLWEATLGVPYGWWVYHPEQMLGIFIGAWSNLPAEAVLLWLVAGWGVVLLYEVIRIYLHMDRTPRDAFFGVSTQRTR
ncbi:MAG: hypothetical protein H6633_23900 [Anaerolineales bacterium]|nr:hypothetical protein [Anaerolineales bacterium]